MPGVATDCYKFPLGKVGSQTALTSPGHPSTLSGVPMAWCKSHPSTLISLVVGTTLTLWCLPVVPVQRVLGIILSVHMLFSKATLIIYYLVLCPIQTDSYHSLLTYRDSSSRSHAALFHLSPALVDILFLWACSPRRWPSTGSPCRCPFRLRDDQPTECLRDLTHIPTENQNPTRKMISIWTNSIP